MLAHRDCPGCINQAVQEGEEFIEDGEESGSGPIPSMVPVRPGMASRLKPWQSDPCDNTAATKVARSDVCISTASWFR